MIDQLSGKIFGIITIIFMLKLSFAFADSVKFVNPITGAGIIKDESPQEQVTVLRSILLYRSNTTLWRKLPYKSYFFQDGLIYKKTVLASQGDDSTNSSVIAFSNTGRRIWEFQLAGAINVSFKKVWREAGLVSAVATYGGAFVTGKDIVFRIGDGSLVNVSEEIVADSFHSILTLQAAPNVLNGEMDQWLMGRWQVEQHILPYTVFNLDGIRQNYDFATPPRPGCGDYDTPPLSYFSSTKNVPLKYGLYSETTIQGELITARRVDKCGKFRYVFNWTKLSPPLIAPGW